jgi:hypothetical protein
VAEELAFQDLLGDGGAVHGDHFLLAAQAVLVNGARDQLLARPAGPGDQHRSRGGRDLADALEDVAHDRGGAHQGSEAFLLRQRLPQRQVLAHHLLPLHSLVHGEQDALLAKRLGDVVESPLLRGLHRRLDGGKSGEHDDGRFRLELLDGFEQADAVHAGHLKVGHDQFHGLGPEAFERPFRVVFGDDLVVPFFRYHAPQQSEHVLFVIDDQDAAGHYLLLTFLPSPLSSRWAA